MHMKGENIIIVFKIKGFSLPHSKQKSVTSIHESKLVETDRKDRLCEGFIQ